MRRVRTIRYREIADAVRERVVAGEFPAGRLLPSEAALSATYEASRVTVRRALEQLKEEGLIDARQGFGWFVARAPIRQSLGHLATLEDQLANALLIISGEYDNTVPWAIAHASFKQQEKNASVTEIQEIPDRGHSLTIDHGWREVAEVALDFVGKFVPVHQ